MCVCVIQFIVQLYDRLCCTHCKLHCLLKRRHYKYYLKLISSIPKKKSTICMKTSYLMNK